MTLAFLKADDKVADSEDERGEEPSRTFLYFYSTSILFLLLWMQESVQMHGHRRRLNIIIAHNRQSIGWQICFNFHHNGALLQTCLWQSHSNSRIHEQHSFSLSLWPMLFISCPLNEGRQLVAGHVQCKDSTQSSSVSNSSSAVSHTAYIRYWFECARLQMEKQVSKKQLWIALTNKILKIYPKQRLVTQHHRANWHLAVKKSNKV